MSQMPEIKPEVNKEPEKKKGGLLARLFGGGGSGGSAGLGGLGGAGAGAGGGLGGLAAGGGLLATKAGLIALILVGTTVAGGIGMLGYRLFGPGGSDANGGDGSNLQLFAPKPKADQSAEGAPKDGTSPSLSMLSGANTTPKEPDAAASGEAPKDATAASATSASPGTGAATGPINKAGDTGNGVNKGLLKNAAKFGQLTAPGGGGGGGASASSAAKAPVVDASKGALSSMRKGGGAAISGGTSRSLAGRKFGGAAGQGFAALANNKSAQSSYAGGQTYDGAASGGSNIGGGGTPIGGAGANTAAAAAQPQSIAGPANSNTSSNIPTPTSAPACPWQGEIQKAQMLIGVAVALLLVAKLLGHTGYGLIITKAIGVAVALIGIMVIAAGAQISGGKYAQKLQGGLLAAAGVGLTIAGVSAGMASSDADASASSSSAPSASSTTSAMGSSSGSSTGMLGGIDPFILLGGGLALAGLAGTMLKPPVTYPAQDANDPNWPKGGLLGYQMQQQQFPSEQALKKLIA